MDTGAIDALIGVGAGTILGFCSAQLNERFSRRRRGRSAARLIWTELGTAKAVAEVAIKHGPGPPPIMPRATQWESHADLVAEIVHPDVLIDLGIAYAAAEMLSDLLVGGQGEQEIADFNTYVANLLAQIQDGQAAILPYARRRSRKMPKLGRGSPA